MHLLANAILVFHFLFVLFILGGMLAIWCGALLGWGWIRNFWFRFLHLAAILFVAAESLLGFVCPLTLWEDWLRGVSSQQAGFIQRWVSILLYYNLPNWMFTTIYVLFALLVLWTFQKIQPNKRQKHLENS